MDGTLPTYEELLNLTRRQAGMIEALRAEVERLKKELEEAERADRTGVAVADAALGLFDSYSEIGQRALTVRSPTSSRSGRRRKSSWMRGGPPVGRRDAKRGGGRRS